MLLIGAFGVAYGSQGAFYRPVQAVVAVMVALAVLASWWGRSSRPSDVVAVLGWAGCGLCAWVVVSAAVNGPLEGSVGTVVLVVGLAAVASVVRGLDADQRQALVAGLVALGCVVAMTGW